MGDTVIDGVVRRGFYSIDLGVPVFATAIGPFSRRGRTMQNAPRSDRDHQWTVPGPVRRVRSRDRHPLLTAILERNASESITAWTIDLRLRGNP